MMEIRSYIFCLLAVLLLVTNDFKSQEVKITGKVYDLASPSEKIPGAKVEFQDKTLALTLDNGEFSFQLPVANTSDTIVISHVGFEPKKIIITASKKRRAFKKDQSIDLSIGLSYVELKQFVVQSTKIDTIYGSKIHHVDDYIIRKDGSLILLVYDKSFNKISRIILTDANQQDLASAIIPEEGYQLYEDYTGIPYVIGEKKVFRINIIDKVIRFETVSEEDFYGFYHRVIDTIGSQYYYSTFNELYPAVSFVATDRQDTTHITLREIKDDFMMELYRAQYKYVSGRDKLWAYRKEQDTGIDKEIWIGAAFFTQDILYKPVYAPLFVMRDTVHIFDQYKKLLFKYDHYHQLVDSVSIDFANNGIEKWEQPLIHDKTSDKVYGLYNKGGFYYIKSINCQDGKIDKVLKLKHRFVERIQITNGKVYYIYRPYESLQKKFLYAEDL